MDAPHPPGTILVVEDSPTQALLLQYYLTQAGYPVQVLPDGLAALAAIRAQPPALVISDIDMPHLDGYGLCRRIKRDPQLRRIPVMLLTALADPVEVVRALECQADQFLTKPYREPYLLAQVAALVQRAGRRPGAAPDDAELVYAGERYLITLDRQRMLDLLLGVYSMAVDNNLELGRTQEALGTLQAQVAQGSATLRALSGQAQQAAQAARGDELAALLDQIHRLASAWPHPAVGPAGPA
jgi:DNA-binding response OmpR family regulator